MRSHILVQSSFATASSTSRDCLRRPGLAGEMRPTTVDLERGSYLRTFAPRRRFEVSYQCHMNCDEWRLKVNKDRKEKVNLTTPI